MPTERFNPSRLRLARRRRGLTKVALADLVDMSSRRLASFENLGDVPPRETIEALASALDFPLAFFYKSDPPEPHLAGVSFRSLSRLTAGRRDRALAAAALAVELAATIGDRYDLPAVSVPDLRELDPGAAADAVRATWALGSDPAPNLIHLLEAHGVRVFSLTDDCAELDAFSMWHGDDPFVFLTAHKSPERARWDAAHELGHLVLHVGYPPQGQRTEQEADEFAAEFLLPARGIQAEAPRTPSLEDIRSHKVRWRVSALAYIRRLNQLGLITDWHYRNLVVEASQAGYRRAEGDIEREMSKIVPQVLQFLAEDGMSLIDLARTLSAPPMELRDLLFGLPTLMPGGGASTAPRSGHLRLA